MAVGARSIPGRTSGNNDLGGWSNGKTPGLQPGGPPLRDGARVQLPGRSTDMNGLMVQRDDTALAWRRSEFDSRWVHWKRLKTQRL